MNVIQFICMSPFLMFDFLIDTYSKTRKFAKKTWCMCKDQLTISCDKIQTIVHNDRVALVTYVTKLYNKNIDRAYNATR